MAAPIWWQQRKFMGVRHERSSGGPGDPYRYARDIDTATRLLARPDGDTLDPFVVRRDKRRVYSDDRRAAVGFGVVIGVGLATGDPIGDPAAFDGAVRNFLGQCENKGWRPAVLGAREETRQIYNRHGLQAMYVGDEAIVDTGQFTMDGRRSRNVRQAVARTVRAAITTEFHREGDLDPTLRDQLLAIIEGHNGHSGDRSFAMGLGGLFSGAYPDCLIVAARDGSGRPVGFQRYVACRQGAALSLDSMYRARSATNGINERMIVDTVNWGRRRGVTAISLNFAAFRKVFDGTADLEHAQASRKWLLRGLEGRLGIQMDSLRRFDAKFSPRWVPRYLVYPSKWNLPTIGLAALSAEGFLPFGPTRRVPAKCRTGRRTSGPGSS
jgi:lysyl-tRNA synthetase, class II